MLPNRPYSTAVQNEQKKSMQYLFLLTLLLVAASWTKVIVRNKIRLINRAWAMDSSDRNQNTSNHRGSYMRGIHSLFIWFIPPINATGHCQNPHSQLLKTFKAVYFICMHKLKLKCTSHIYNNNVLYDTWSSVKFCSAGWVYAVLHEYNFRIENSQSVMPVKLMIVFFAATGCHDTKYCKQNMLTPALLSCCTDPAI